MRLVHKRERSDAAVEVPMRAPPEAAETEDEAKEGSERQASYETTTSQSASFERQDTAASVKLMERQESSWSTYERQDTSRTDTSELTGSMQSHSYTADSLRDAMHKGQTLQDVIPRWRCFVKSVSSSHVLLTFIPASFEDLCVLVPAAATEGAECIEKVEEDEGDVIVTAKTESLEAESEQKDPAPSGLINGHEACNTTSLQTQPKELNATLSHHNGASEEAEGQTEVKGSEQNSEGQAEVKCQAGEKGNGDSEDRAEDCAEGQGNENAEGEKGLNEESPSSSLKSYVLPVYVYDCTMSDLVEQLTNKWSFDGFPDIFQDLTFKYDPLEMDKYVHPRVHMDSIRSDLSEGRDSRKDSEGDRDPLAESGKLRWARQESRTEDAIFGVKTDLKTQCFMVTEAYYKCFVNGKSTTLLKDYIVLYM